MPSFKDKACTSEVLDKVLSHFNVYGTWLQELAASRLRLEGINTVNIVFPSIVSLD